MKKSLSVVLLALAACVSRSVWDERFLQSQTLSAPPLEVVLPSDRNFSFVMVGDLHVGGSHTDRFRNILQKAQAAGDDFVVLLGDLTDKGEAESFLAIREALADFSFEKRVIPLLGNHDVFSEGWNEYKKTWGASHYSLTLGNSRFIVLDTADGLIGKEQWEWIQNTLESVKETHTFILTHYMPLVPGQRTYLRLSNQTEAERLMKLASQKQVRGVFGGHYHSYCQEKIAGVDYVVAGGGGGRRMEPIQSHFFVRVTINGSEVSYQLELLD